ncbi:MAG: HAMP domain-containing histidine kinase [Sphaerochaetaceae bacterium]|nr:HAMP domain-containing histidine kinase [Sphaerochaetaceae bacterium]
MAGREIQGFIRRKWKFIEGKERLFVYIGMAILYITIFVFALFVYENLTEKATLEMKFESERSFNSIYMALNDNTSKVTSTMEQENVYAIGIYASNGKAYQRLGDAPEVLPLAKLAGKRQKGSDSTSGIYIFDKETKEIEYFRLSRFSAVMETGNFGINENGFIQMPLDFPDIIYVRFDGSSYSTTLKTLAIVVTGAMVVISILFGMVISIYENNRRYRITLEKNESLAKLGAAARTLTHEIKNPLSAMTIQSALMKKLLPEQYHGDLTIMDHEIQRLTNLTNRVSDFLKNPMGEPEEIELISFISGLVPLFPQKIGLEFNGLKAVYIDFDPDRARSVFENLMKNALESTLDRDPEVEVEVRLLKHKMVSVAVKDRGVGLSKADREKMYDPFYTTKVHGSGIGLSISKQFVEARGGVLRLLDREGGGTVAEVVLNCRSTSEVENENSDS